MYALIVIPKPSLEQLEALIYEDVLKYNSIVDAGFDEMLIDFLAASESFEDFKTAVLNTIEYTPRQDYVELIVDYLMVVWVVIVVGLNSRGLVLIKNQDQNSYGKVYAVSVRSV
jgi:hypothetical protein